MDAKMETVKATFRNTRPIDAELSRALDSQGLRMIVCSESDGLEINHSAPGWINVAPWGRVESSSGTFIVDEVACANAINAFRERGVDIIVDYEHQTLGGRYASTTGIAPAAGWIKELRAEPGVGLMGRVEWTERARKAIASKEFRHISPVILALDNDQRASAVFSVALTNNPAIRGARAIVNSSLGDQLLAPERLKQSAIGVANRFAKEWDDEPLLQKLTSREAYVDQALRDAIGGSFSLSAEDKQRIKAGGFLTDANDDNATAQNAVRSKTRAERMSVINNVIRLHHEAPSSVRLNFSAANIADSELRSAGLERLSATERMEIEFQTRRNAQRPEPKPEDRTQVINSAAAMYESNPKFFQGLGQDKLAFVNGELLSKRLEKVSETEARALFV